ncbi:CaiB/BaiF CoA transferase family protein [Parvularcula oceani]|uniref:CaiB/BaiF CoA transferase family protein n=1 Tax=Parvularcula oceani TaxID=1247963 RepID=UPI0004E23C8F|nr:CaiB/BaiF CoA-transferase family protein [Parvularcula oceani]
MHGPLSGLRIVEFAGIGPGPFCGMMLADHGAEVVRIERVGAAPVLDASPLDRSRRTIGIDTKSEEGVALARRLAAGADGLIEGFRPGVMERLGLGPDTLLGDNPKLVYGRMTGWGQDGPYAQAAGHDINYIALSGMLHTCGRAGEKPTPPVNYLGDFAGGGMMLAFGMVSALLHVQRGGEGQVIDCAMTDGSALIGAITWGMHASGMWRDERGVNLLDTGAPFYETYETKDGKFVALGAIEPHFYALLLERLGLAGDETMRAQMQTGRWEEQRALLTRLFRMRTREEWCEILEGTDACFAPVLSLSEAPRHPHNAARGTFAEVAGRIQPAPAPRYSETGTRPPEQAAAPGADTQAILSELGLEAGEIARLREGGVVG